MEHSADSGSWREGVGGALRALLESPAAFYLWGLREGQPLEVLTRDSWVLDKRQRAQEKIGREK